MVHRGQGSVWPAHRKGASAQPGESLRRSDLVDQVQVGVQDGGTTVFMDDDMSVPDFVEECARRRAHPLPTCRASAMRLNSALSPTMPSAVSILFNAAM